MNLEETLKAAREIHPDIYAISVSFDGEYYATAKIVSFAASREWTTDDCPTEEAALLELINVLILDILGSSL